MGSRQSDSPIAEPLSGEIKTDSTSCQLSDALNQIVASKALGRSEQLKKLLIYLRDAAESADPHVCSETAIGTTVFGRKDFNPKLDTIVRVEMLRLRRKLDEYYATEGAASPLRVRFEKNTYRPYIQPYTPPIVEPEIAKPQSRFWTGVAVGGGAMALLAVLTGMLVWTWTHSKNAVPAEVAETPIWSGFRGKSVVIAVGTPLFFRYESGFERSFNVNVPEDLAAAEKSLAHWPAFPLWNRWTAFEDIGSVLRLDRFLNAMESNVQLVSARQLSIGNLAGQRTIVLGQPRNSPLLIDVLADQNFRPPRHVLGESFSGVINTDPQPGEPGGFSSGVRTLLEQHDESSPDHALVTSIRLNNGGEVLSVFGDRIQTGAFVVAKLLDPAFMESWTERVFASASRTHQSAQIVFRVDYNRGTPTGLVYVTHRVRLKPRE